MAVSALNVPIYTAGSPPTIIPVVLPASEDLSQSAKVRNVPVYGAIDTSGWLVWDPYGKEWLVSPAMRGYRHLRDYYAEEDNLEGWKTYKRYLTDWQNKETTEAFPLDLLPKKVQEMQQGLTGAFKPDPWRRQPKPTTGTLAKVPGAPAPEQPSRRPRGPRVTDPTNAPSVTPDDDEPEAA